MHGTTLATVLCLWRGDPGPRASISLGTTDMFFL